MNNEKIKVKFYALSQYYETVTNCMVALVPNGETLYAEIEIPEEGFDKNGNWINKTVEIIAKKYGYEELKADIIEQAKSKGINPEQLKFCSK